MRPKFLNQLVEQPVTGWFAELVWTTVSAYPNLHQTYDLLLPRLLARRVSLVEALPLMISLPRPPRL